MVPLLAEPGPKHPPVVAVVVQAATLPVVVVVPTRPPVAVLAALRPSALALGGAVPLVAVAAVEFAAPHESEPPLAAEFLVGFVATLQPAAHVIVHESSIGDPLRQASGTVDEPECEPFGDGAAGLRVQLAIVLLAAAADGLAKSCTN